MSLCRAGRFAEDVLRTTNELESVVTIIVANDKQMPRRDPLRPYMAVSPGAAYTACMWPPAAGLPVYCPPLPCLLIEMI